MKAGKGDGWIESKSYCLLRRLFQRATNHKLKSKPKSSHPILSFMQIPPSYYYPFNLGYRIHRIIATSEVASIIHILHCHRRSPPIRRSSIEVAKIAGSIFGDIKEAKMAGSMEFRFSSMNFRLRSISRYRCTIII